MRTILLILAMGFTGILNAQTMLQNSDGTTSRYFYSDYGSTIIYPDFSFGIITDHNPWLSTIVYSDGDFSRIVYGDLTTTIIHSDFSFTVLRNQEDAPIKESLSINTPTPQSKAESDYTLLTDESTPAKPDPNEKNYILLKEKNLR